MHLLEAASYLKRKRLIRPVTDRALFRIPGMSQLLKVINFFFNIINYIINKKQTIKKGYKGNKRLVRGVRESVARRPCARG